MKASRRIFITTLLSLLAWPAMADKGFHRHPHRAKRRLRRARIVHNSVSLRRIRRTVAWGTLRGRRLLIVPKALNQEWELLIDGELVVVQYVHASRIVVVNKEGATRTIDVLKKDTDENTKELEGSKYDVKTTSGADQ